MFYGDDNIHEALEKVAASRKLLKWGKKRILSLKRKNLMGVPGGELNPDMVRFGFRESGGFPTGSALSSLRAKINPKKEAIRRAKSHSWSMSGYSGKPPWKSGGKQ